MKGIVFILCMTGFCLISRANKLYVGNGQLYKTIHSALEAASAGDTIQVEEGIYHEKNLLVNKRVYLLGIHYPVMDGEKKYEIISVRADGVVIDGFRIIHSGISSVEDFGGIKIYHCRDVIIANNILDDTFFGIYSQQGVNCTDKE